MAKDPKLPPLESEGSSSSLPAVRSRLDLSLEAIFDEMGSAQQGINSGVRQINNKVDQLIKDSKVDHAELETVKRWVGQILVSNTTVADRVRDLTIAIERSTIASIDGRKADLALGAKIGAVDEKLDQLQKTGANEAFVEGEDTAPKPVRVLVLWITNLGWKHKRKVIAGVGTVATAAWAYAAPSIIEAIKVFFGGS